MMKKWKRFGSLCLAVLMALALAVPGLAAGNGTITVDNPAADHTYTAYKIFDVKYNTGKTAYSYTISNTSEWYDTVKTYAERADSGLTLTASATDTTVFVVSTTATFSAPDFAAALKAAVSEKTGTVLTLAEGKATATGLDLGYYFVTSSNGALCNLTTTNPTVTIHDKNDIPFDKTDDQESVDVGQVVNYVITGKVPDYTGFKTYTYQLTDKMSEGLTFNSDVKIYIDGTEITENFTLKPGDTAGNYDFILDIDVMKYQIGKKIEVKYSATVNEQAVARIENNHAELKYSNDPADSESTGKFEDEETVYSAKIVIDKYVSGSESTKLAGAEFILYKEDKDEETTTKYYYKWNDTSKKVEWTTTKSEATVKTTDSNGAASFDGIADGTYYLEETKAPDGYSPLTRPVEVTINGSNATLTDLSSLTYIQQVENNTGATLPETGGMGTTLFYVIGGILVVGAGVVLVSKKRMQ